MGDFIDEYYADKDLSLLKKLTLVIPTHNRNYYLSRCLWYHAHFPFGQIIVADSSPEEKKVVNRETVTKIREMFGSNILYLEYEPETEKYGGDIYRKWGDAVQHVGTEYSQICTDKEFLIPTTLCLCVEFLETHLDYSIAEGMDWQIRSFSNGDFVFSPWQGHSSLEQPTLKERFNAYMTGNGSGTLFSIQRSINQKKIFDNLIKYDIYDIRFGETAIEVQPFFYGKTKKIITNVANLRDVRHVYKSASLFRNKQNTESSYDRYPALINYPKEDREILSQNLYDCLEALALEVSSDKKQTQDILSPISISKIVEMRYPTKIKLTYWKFQKIIWGLLPSVMQRGLFIPLRLGLTNKMIPEYFLKEIECVTETIQAYDHLHNTDQVITLESG